MKLTKRCKRVSVTFHEIKSYRSKYDCPSCRARFYGEIQKNVTRFKCDCGQGLIVN